MEVWASVIGTVVAVLAFWTSFDPRVTSDGRRQARLARDLELLERMPKGAASERLRTHVEQAAVELLDERGRDKIVERAPWVLFAGFALSVAGVSVVQSVPTATLWGSALHSGLAVLSIGMLLGSTAGIVILAVTNLLRWIGAVRRWVSRRSAGTVTE